MLKSETGRRQALAEFLGGGGVAEPSVSGVHRAEADRAWVGSFPSSGDCGRPGSRGGASGVATSFVGGDSSICPVPHRLTWLASEGGEADRRPRGHSRGSASQKYRTAFADVASVGQAAQPNFNPPGPLHGLMR